MTLSIGAASVTLMFRSIKKPSLQVSVTRADFPESVHLVDAAIVNSQGDVFAAYGDVERPVYPRSAIKPLQAVSFVESHAVSKFLLQDKHISLACSSHAGDDLHTGTVAEWLARLHLQASDLVCAPHEPFDKETAIQYYSKHQDFTRLNNNCSGKHAGILSTCAVLGFDVKNYGDYDHPIQKRLREILSILSQEKIDENPWGVDGCGIPTYTMSLAAMARGMAALSGPEVTWHNYHWATEKIRNAMIREPHYFSGKGQFCTEIITHTKGRVLIKTGAEGMCCLLLPQTGMGIALKAQDGGLRAVEAASLWLLGQLSPWSDDESARLGKLISPVLRNWSGLEVGKVIVTGHELE